MLGITVYIQFLLLVRHYFVIRCFDNEVCDLGSRFFTSHIYQDELTNLMN